MASHGYEVLLEDGEWQFMRGSESMVNSKEEEYIMLAHMGCPNGVWLKAYGGGEPSVMHFEDYVCQRCSASPPDGLFATYKLYAWGAGIEDL